MLFFEKINIISNKIDIGQFEDAFELSKQFLKRISKSDVKNTEIFAKLIFNLSGQFIDIGAMQPNSESAKIGIELLEKNREIILANVSEEHYYYNLANAKSNFVKGVSPFVYSFETIEDLIELKNYFWKTIKFSTKNTKKPSPEYIVNLANSLKQQFRVVEAMGYYDLVNSLSLDIPQSWINRSESLMVLNTISNTFSVEMLKQVKLGYQKAISSKKIPPQWIDYYNKQIEDTQSKIDAVCNDYGILSSDENECETELEFSQLSKFRQFCLSENLTLSEHGLYCKCYGSARDDLAIMRHEDLSCDFIIPMEMILNRLKSEFSLARHLYYEYICCEDSIEQNYESCFSELRNDELLGIDIEKLRTSFRLCFGIMDKIGSAICDFFDVYPPNGTVAFQSFWQLGTGNRREKFEKIKSPGLLALYSIATDLNDRKDGEWAFYKNWRNDLEHKFVVVHKSAQPSDLYKSFKLRSGVILIRDEEFISHLQRLLQLTRSAIFSFAFAVRDKALKQKDQQSS